MNISDYKKLEIIYFLTQLKMMKLGYTSEKDPVLLINFICCSNGYYASLFDGLDDIDLANVELVLARTFDDVIEEIAGFNIEKLHFEELQPYVNFTLLGMKRKDGGVKQDEHDPDEMTNEPYFKIERKDY